MSSAARRCHRACVGLLGQTSTGWCRRSSRLPALGAGSRPRPTSIEINPLRVDGATVEALDAVVVWALTATRRRDLIHGWRERLAKLGVLAKLMGFLDAYRGQRRDARVTASRAPAPA